MYQARAQNVSLLERVGGVRSPKELLVITPVQVLVPWECLVSVTSSNYRQVPPDRDCTS